jgi:hypothetical protein
MLAGRLDDQRAAAEDPVEQGLAERDVRDSRQRNVPAVAHDYSSAQAQPPRGQLIPCRPPDQQRIHQQQHEYRDGHDRQCQPLDRRGLARGDEHLTGKRRRDQDNRQQDRPHQRLPVRMQNLNRLLADRQRLVITHTRHRKTSRLNSRVPSPEPARERLGRQLRDGWARKSLFGHSRSTTR